MKRQSFSEIYKYIKKIQSISEKTKENKSKSAETPDSLNLFSIHHMNFSLPLWFFKNTIVDLSTVDLSIFLVFELTILPNSLTNMLNWSRRFFSLIFRDFLEKMENLIVTILFYKADKKHYGDRMHKIDNFLWEFRSILKCFYAKQMHNFCMCWLT